MSNEVGLTRQPRFAFPSYLAVFCLILFPLFDQAMQLLSTAKFGDPRWRFGAAGLFTNLLVLPTIGVMMAFALTFLYDHRVLRRLLSVVCILVSLVLLAMGAAFLLDAVQVRALMRPEAQSSWAIATATAFVKLSASMIALAGFGYAGIRRANAKKSVSSGRIGTSSLLVGTRTNAATAESPVQ